MKERYAFINLRFSGSVIWLLLISWLLLPVFQPGAARAETGLASPLADDNPITATDGTLQVYQIRGANSTLCNGRQLFSSSDGGQTWQERGQQFAGRILSVAPAYVDSRSIYLVASDGTATTDNYPIFSLYFSSDAGVTWEKRYQGQGTYQDACTRLMATVQTLPGRMTPVGAVSLVLSNGFAYFKAMPYKILVSNDGGYTFSQVDEGSNYHPFSNPQLLYSYQTFIRFNIDKNDLSRSGDGGKTWLKLTPPVAPLFIARGPDGSGTHAVLEQSPNAPGNLFMYTSTYPQDNSDLWYSTDSGSTWKKIAPGVVKLSFSDFSPTVAQGYDKNGMAVTLNLPDLDRFQTMYTIANGAAGGAYFSATGHNLYGAFKTYWEQHGGLALFGYPKTEPFREFNPSDGKIYIVQYFERNRFEYHPENVGTQYEVLLGLLGVQLTEQRAKNGEGAFRHFDDAHYLGGIYFSETGHNLRNSFKTYWEQNGGLPIFGYPISEEFYEVNPDDGNTYVVQYFERNRFEWHPENKGTQYEVLLGLLGNTFLKQKGWL